MAKARFEEYVEERVAELAAPKEARRIVVYKMDLGMKPEKFEAMLAETAKKIQEA